ncbi:MerR family transcriptional regulator [Glutamicibacter sp. JC586]|uniref:MerR family transcriptional regulator n=1 Tax=Glutamicibacter sp. JC586 TaxID=2590552 RepID=UPI001F3B2DDE|nr:MerR family transcriptional regulator [Glutamicibacter sp. JC586]
MAAMKIGEAAQEIGAPPRMLRYYEQQGLIQSDRSANGYREYSADQIEHARHVRALVTAGLSSRMIKIVLNIESPDVQKDSRELAVDLVEELRAVEERIVCLEKSRDSVIEFLQRTSHADLLAGR